MILFNLLFRSTSCLLSALRIFYKSRFTLVTNTVANLICKLSQFTRWPVGLLLLLPYFWPFYTSSVCTFYFFSFRLILLSFYVKLWHSIMLNVVKISHYLFTLILQKTKSLLVVLIFWQKIANWGYLAITQTTQWVALVGNYNCLAQCMHDDLMYNAHFKGS